MSIKQFNATYLAADDRILFRFNTAEDTEFRFWLTRRATLFILAATQHLMMKGLEQTHSPQAAKAIAEFGKEAMQIDPSAQGISQVDAYQSASNYPLGADPLLVMDVKCTLEKQGLEDGVSLDLVLPGGANINVKMAGSTLQTMSILLNQLREHAAWGEIPLVSDVAIQAEDKNKSGNKPLVH
jgi:hypothetical protein